MIINNTAMTLSKDPSGTIDNYSLFNTLPANGIGKIAVTLGNEPVSVTLDMDKNPAGNSFIIIGYKIESSA